MAVNDVSAGELISHLQLGSGQAFCFVLGAGASRPSGIPTGRELVTRWLEEIHAGEGVNRTPLSIWATAQTLNIEGFKFSRAARFYPQVFKRRFAGRPEEGYALVEDLLRGREPSPGYLILAQILADERLPHRAVITPNFDHLTTDALAIVTRAAPMVCDHESFTGLIRPQPNGPLIARTYRDLLREPLNAPPGVTRLGPGWDYALRNLLGRATPVVIGYGGNDGSLLEFLRDLPAPVPGGLFWCHLAAEGAPDPDILAVVEQHHGCLVPITGFDELMLQLGETLGLPPLPGLIEARAREREGVLGERLAALHIRPAPPPPPIVATLPSTEVVEPWRVWDQRAEDEPNPNRQEAILREGLAALPGSADLMERLAEFLYRVRKDPIAAEPCYLRALELNPQHTDSLSHYGAFLAETREDFDAAERLLRQSLEIDPTHSRHTGMLGTFLYKTRHDFDEAERLYRLALELDPFNGITTGNFANFLSVVRHSYDEAERLYRRAMFLPPNYSQHVGNYAVFLYMVRGDETEAERLFLRAMELDSNDTGTQRKYQVFLRRRTPATVVVAAAGR